MTVDITALNQSQVESLVERSRVACVVYTNHPLPIGVLPSRGRIGIESAASRALLHVDRGLHYVGAQPQVARLLDEGSIEFSSVTELISWYRQQTRPSVRLNLARHPASGSAVQPLAMRLERHLLDEVIDQDAPVRAAVQLVASHVAKPDPRGPATMLFVGPTGVGKTFLAEQIASGLEALVDPMWSCFRVDMNEYEDHHRVASLLGAPPGYVGYASAPAFLEHLAANPRSVVILDELEKAHPDVLYALMNALDTGRLTPSNGASPLDLTRCVFVATSNLAAFDVERFCADNPNVDQPTAVRRLMIGAGLRAEVVNRFDAVVPFGRLSSAGLAALVVAEMRRVCQEFGVRATLIDPEVSLLVADDLDDLATFGARSVRRAANRLLGNSLSNLEPGAIAALTIQDGAIVAREERGTT